MLIGEAATEKLRLSRVCVFGVGGVGGYAVEALARAGVGAIDIFDCDRVSESNLNRQIIATVSTVGELKTDVSERRILDINPDCRVTKHNEFVTPKTVCALDLSVYDYIIDAIDTVSAKIALAVRCDSEGLPLIASMGTGNKLDPTAFEISDIYKTSVCPLARVMRVELKRRGVKRLKVLYSKETPIKPIPEEKFLGKREGEHPAKAAPASISFVPSVAGLLIASEVIKEIINNGRESQ